ncbi:NR5A2 family protein [Megaselia abdita]
MLLDMEQQQSTASFMVSLNISPFSMNLNQPSSPVHGSTQPQQQQPTNNNNNNTSNSNANNNNNNNNNDGDGTGSDSKYLPDYPYAIGNTPLHMNNNSLQQQQSHQHQQQQQQQQQYHHQQQQQQNNIANPNNFSYSYIYNNFESSPYIFSTGYQDNASSHSHQSGSGGGGGGSNGSNLNSSSSSGGPPNNGSSNGMLNANNSNSGYITLIPPPVGGGNTTSNQTNQNGDPIDFKHLFEELCPVCGDKVSGYHYGLLTCESCKGFFKRTVQNKKVYTCVAERNCHIDKTQRKRCPFCRFNKCINVGMKLEAVREDRMRGGRNKFGPMYKRDRARKLQIMRQRQIALQAIRTTIGSADIKPGQLSPNSYQTPYNTINIKQEIQIPQVSSLTQSPDSSPSPIAIALGQVNPNTTSVIPTSLTGNGGVSTMGTTNTSAASLGGIGSNSGNGNNTYEHDSSVSLQHTSNSKICYDNTNPSSTADSMSSEPLRVSPMIRDFVQTIDDREWQAQLFDLLQKQSYNQVEVDLFELMCKVLDQNLFSQVDWARNTVFFKDLKVDDQMKLLQHSWSDMLVLDHLHQRIHNSLQDETTLHNGQIFNLLNLGILGVPDLVDFFNKIQCDLQELKFDMGDYVCMKFLILLNPNVRNIQNKKTVADGYASVEAALCDYTLTCYSHVDVSIY